MTKNEEIDFIITKLASFKVEACMGQINGVNNGVGAVLRYLDFHPGVVTAGDLAKDLNVSTARIAALLNKMEKRGLIAKGHGENDKRITTVKMKEEGKRISHFMREHLYLHIGILIDKIGFEKMKDFISTLDQVIATIPLPCDMPKLM